MISTHPETNHALTQAPRAARFLGNTAIVSGASRGIRINAVAPAIVKTKFASALYEGREDQVAKSYPLKRLGVASDVESGGLPALRRGRVDHRRAPRHRRRGDLNVIPPHTSRHNPASPTPVNPPGLDLALLSTWFSSAVPNVNGLLSARLLAGGRSNLTYAVTDGHCEWIVRRPPLGHVLETAHDMAREYRVMEALRDTNVPVPTMHAMYENTDILGAPFYVMELVAGTSYRQAAELEVLGPERTRRIAETLVDALVALHAVDAESVGLADLGRPEGFLPRQVQRWKQQLDASRSRALPGADELHARLAADVPPDSAAGIVHGDYRLDNVLVDDRDRLVAVIDWEMATLGDPLTDLALMVVYRFLGDLDGGHAVANTSSASGFLTDDEICARYARQSSRDLSRFGFYLGLAAYKLAAVVEGIHYRHLSGQTVGPGFENVGTLTEPLLEAGLAYLKDD